jgi:hypothetical protein
MLRSLPCPIMQILGVAAVEEKGHEGMLPWRRRAAIRARYVIACLGRRCCCHTCQCPESESARPRLRNQVSDRSLHLLPCVLWCLPPPARALLNSPRSALRKSSRAGALRNARAPRGGGGAARRGGGSKACEAPPSPNVSAGRGSTARGGHGAEDRRDCHQDANADIPVNARFRYLVI